MADQPNEKPEVAAAAADAQEAPATENKPAEAPSVEDKAAEPADETPKGGDDKVAEGKLIFLHT